MRQKRAKLLRKLTGYNPNRPREYRLISNGNDRKPSIVVSNKEYRLYKYLKKEV